MEPAIRVKSTTVYIYKLHIHMYVSMYLYNVIWRKIFKQLQIILFNFIIYRLIALLLIRTASKIIEKRIEFVIPT